MRRGRPGIVTHHLSLFVIFVTINPVKQVGLGQHSWPDRSSTVKPLNAGALVICRQPAGAACVTGCVPTGTPSATHATRRRRGHRQRQT
jgi:hypothetical protein